jgi:hypothetical protein
VLAVDGGTFQQNVIMGSGYNSIYGSQEPDQAKQWNRWFFQGERAVSDETHA